jgi:muramidase (phage lysozyme)
MPVILIVLILLLAPHTAQAEALRGSLFAATSAKPDGALAGLFVGRSQGGMFAPRPDQRLGAKHAVGIGLQKSDVQMIRALIQEAESRKDGYNALQHGARIKPAKRPTRMTLEELLAWIDATPGQPHAIGLYQFIPKTLRRLIEKTGAKLSQRFDPKMQDQLADVLLAEAGLQKFRAGTLQRQAFMNNMAKIWAGLPTSNGKSHYDGYAGNKAMVTWARFDAVMARISPKQS